MHFIVHDCYTQCVERQTPKSLGHLYVITKIYINCHGNTKMTLHFSFDVAHLIFSIF